MVLIEYLMFLYNTSNKCYGGNIYTSEKSRSERSSAILAAWPSVSGVLLRTPHEDDLRVGIVQFFILHTPHIRKDIVDNATALTNVEILKEPHIYCLN